MARCFPRVLASMVSIGALAVACNSQHDATTPKDPATPVKNVTLESVGLSAAAIDRSVDPCDDFYQYACGSWLTTTKIPDDKARWGRGFSMINERNEKVLKQLVEKALNAPGTGAHMKKVGDLYASCMNEKAIEAVALSPIKSWLLAARGVKNPTQVAAVMTTLHRYGLTPVFRIDVDQDFKNTDVVIAHFYQAGLGLPDRDYYIKTDERSKGLRKAYIEHMARMFVLAGHGAAEAKKAAARVMTLETMLAKASKTRVEMRDPKKIYNRIDRSGLEAKVSSFDWKSYFSGLGYSDMKEISITSPLFFDAFNRALTEQPAAAWASYLEWKVLAASAMSLSKRLVDESFRMSSSLSGQKSLQPRWKRCLSAAKSTLGDYVGKAYVDVMFAGESKSAAERMVHGISDAFARNVNGYDWMDAATKAKALEKRKKMAYLIGYPANWKTYDFVVERGAYAKNMLAGRAHEQHYQLGKVGKAVDRNEWFMSPATVNAYYHPLMNHMVFPAAILQPPFYDVKSTTGVNLGAMGMIVGHELTHGFDDQGSQFAASGRLENWWSPAVAKKFKIKTQCVVDQYAKYEVLPGVKVNGKLTLGENIADHGGVKLAYQAFKQAQEGASERLVADGHTEEQQFFLAVGQAWCSKSRDKIARMLVNVDPHSPPKFRVIGSLSNMPEFSEAFSCKPSAPMNPPDKCTVW